MDMISRILVPMDASEQADRALSFAFENHPAAEVTVLHVVGVPTKMMGEAASLALEDDFDDAAEERASPVFERARAIASEYDTRIDTAVAIGRPARAILQRAEGFDAIVMGSHGRHSEDITRRLLVGDVAKTVFRRSPIPVTSVR